LVIEQPLRVVIAEDSALIREGVARLIEESGGTVVAKVGDGDAFVVAVEEHRPDVSVVDVRMPPTQRDEGLRAAIEARRRGPGSPVPLLSQYGQGQSAGELARCSRAPSTWRASVRASCSRTAAAAWATCSRTASPTCASSWTRWRGWRPAA